MKLNSYVFEITYIPKGTKREKTIKTSFQLFNTNQAKRIAENIIKPHSNVQHIRIDGQLDYPINYDQVKRYNLVLFRKVNGTYQQQSTLVWDKPYPLCKGEKIKYEANNKSHFEFLKIVPNA